MSDQSLDVPTTVKNLLLSTKQLQYTLEEWSIGRADDEEVSNVYVKIGTEFNLVVRAFGMYRIDMSELYPIPTDLREVLEQCLAEDASPQVLALYLPGVKKVFISLLKGLRDRQLMWRDRDGSMNGTGTFRSFT
ncbi:hypothetical protein DL96DRAFT_1581881 [Flagelloscypha sp. PMI_526]|nr:hypothetical protein DL96DRAFT_1581881 [Flagelloscypha sp. PMI_526]